MEAIIVAAIGAVGGIIAVLVQKSREENKDDHNKVMEKLIQVHKDINQVELEVNTIDMKLDQHLSLDHPTTKVKDKSKKK